MLLHSTPSDDVFSTSYLVLIVYLVCLRRKAAHRAYTNHRPCRKVLGLFFETINQIAFHNIFTKRIAEEINKKYYTEILIQQSEVCIYI